MLKTTSIINKVLFILSLILTPIAVNSQDITGVWNGMLNVSPERSVLFVFTIRNEKSRLSAELAIPSRGIKGLKAGTTTFDDGVLLIDAASLGFNYKGKWNAHTGEVEGAFQEGINSFSLRLTKAKIEEVRLHRPQEPTKPYPYFEEDVRFQNRKNNITLAGTLTMPRDKSKKHPAVVLITGSGPQNRDEEMFGHKPFLVLADHLTRRGIAVLRYDDRGIAKSTGDFNTATSADFATDVLSAVEFLKTRDEIDIRHIGLIGHSEGGSIAPMAANGTKDIAFIVLLAAPGISGKDTALWQAEAEQFRPQRIRDAEAYTRFNKKVIEIAASDKGIPEKKVELAQLYQTVEIALKEMAPEGANMSAIISRQIDGVLSNWSQFFYRYDPAAELEKVAIPVLSLNGSNDRQVDAKVNQAAIKMALDKGGNQKYEIIEMKGLNHFFQESKTGNITEYAAIEQTFAPQAIEALSIWVLKQVSPPVHLVIVGSVNPSEQKAFDFYADQMRRLYENVGATVTDRYPVVQTLMGEDRPDFILVVKFPGEQALNKLFSSDEYKALLPYRDRGFGQLKVFISVK